MDVIWDPAKARANWKKHEVSFPDAEAVLWDPYALTKEDPDSENEQRFVALGLDSIGRVLAWSIPMKRVTFGLSRREKPV